TITPVKYYIDIQDYTYPAIIDSRASVSMILHQTVKKLNFKIEELSKSLIVTATGTTSRPLRIIRNLPIRIQDWLIPLDIEVVPATSYFILLRNDWSKKVEANYN
ncbi:1150_t:CDS:1, partial [Racocetra persica]